MPGVHGFDGFHAFTYSIIPWIPWILLAHMFYQSIGPINSMSPSISVFTTSLVHDYYGFSGFSGFHRLTYSISPWIPYGYLTESPLRWCGEAMTCHHGSSYLKYFLFYMNELLNLYPYQCPLWQMLVATCF